MKAVYKSILAMGLLVIGIMAFYFNHKGFEGELLLRHIGHYAMQFLGLTIALNAIIFFLIDKFLAKNDTISGLDDKIDH